ncbi:hypothetical protein IKG10_02830 [Candidatus Saccharibacteria bacterium]|nr:hypothetical protein [Candidatus Saccharibacteria bacterium]
MLWKKILFLKSLSIAFGETNGLDKDWAGLYTGFGNYLFVRSKYKSGILDYIDKNYGDSGYSKTVELYSHWYDALNSVFVGKKPAF